ncbi:MAG: hypothetical protein SGBAC_002259 [Bacillariaceae sp.]
MTTLASTTVNLGGASFSIHSAAGNPLYQPVSIPKETGHERSDYELAKHEKYCIKAGQLMYGDILELMERSDHTSFDDVYKSTRIIEQIKTPLKNYDMDCSNELLDLFEDYGQIPDSQVMDNVEYMMTWVHDERVPAVYDSSGNVSTPAIPGAPWVLMDMLWSAKFLKNQMSSALYKATKDDLKDKGIDKKHHDLGPVLFKGLVDRMMNSNYSALELLKRELTRDNLSLDQFDGDIEEMAKKLTTIIKRLRKCEIRDKSGNIQGIQHVPSNLSKSLLLVLKHTGHESFDEIMEAYVSFKIAHEWDETPGGNKNPSAFITGGNNTQAQCFGCEKIGCCQTERTCSRFGKSATPAGAQAKADFAAAKLKRKEGKKQGNSGGRERNKQTGCKFEGDEPVNGLPAGLAALVVGKAETAEIRLMARSLASSTKEVGRKLQGRALTPTWWIKVFFNQLYWSLGPPFLLLSRYVLLLLSALSTVAMESPSETFALLFSVLLGGIMWWVVGILDDSNDSEFFPGLVGNAKPPDPSLHGFSSDNLGACEATKSKSLQETSIKSWFSPRAMLRMLIVAFEAMVGYIPEVQIIPEVEFYQKARPRQQNVELPQAYPLRGCPSHQKRGPRHYHLRMRI